MNNLEKFISVQNVAIPMFDYVINLVLTIFLSAILSYLFTRYGQTLSNRSMFGKNFILLSTTTMIVISIVKSSLALSLGLVGALSIVRFRTAIKEPEELVYLFICICIGLGLGAGQRLVTLVGFFAVVVILILGNMYGKKSENQNLHLVLKSKGPSEDELEKIASVLRKYCTVADLKRFDEEKEVFETAFYIEISDFATLNELKKDLKSIYSIDQISFFDSKGMA